MVTMSWLDTLEDIRKKDFSKQPMAKRDEAARTVVNMASYACAVVSVSPIPFSDAVLMLPVQSAMVVTVGHVYGRKVTEADAKSLIVELATTAGLGMLARQGIKAILPIFGALLTVPAAFVRLIVPVPRAMVSLKEITRLLLIATPLAPSAGLKLNTVGAVVSVIAVACALSV